jgi:hypothetical protein
MDEKVIIVSADSHAGMPKELWPDYLSGGGEVRQDLIDNFATRGGYLKPAEGGAKLPFVDEVLEQDLVGLSKR